MDVGYGSFGFWKREFEFLVFVGCGEEVVCFGVDVVDYVDYYLLGCVGVCGDCCELFDFDCVVDDDCVDVDFDGVFEFCY